MHKPDYNIKLETLEQFILMSYGPLSDDKIKRITDIFEYYNLKIYLEHQMVNFNNDEADTEDIFLGIWKFLHESLPKLIKELENEINIK